MPILVPLDAPDIVTLDVHLTVLPLVQELAHQVVLLVLELVQVVIVVAILETKLRNVMDV